jgi:preprotein translocase subunit YajC
MNFIASAQAQTAATTTAAASNPIMQFVPFILVFVVFYFLMIRPQKKRLEEEQKLITQLTKGDEIYTKSGVIGVITGLTEKIVTIEISEGVKMKVIRSQIGGLANKLFDATNKEQPNVTA